MTIVDNLLFPAGAVTKARILSVIAGLVCAVLVSFLAVPHSQSTAAKAPTLMFWEFPNPDCGGEGCYMVACMWECGSIGEILGSCCHAEAEQRVSCLYCGP